MFSRDAEHRQFLRLLVKQLNRLPGFTFFPSARMASNCQLILVSSELCCSAEDKRQNQPAPCPAYKQWTIGSMGATTGENQGCQNNRQKRAAFKRENVEGTIMYPVIFFTQCSILNRQYGRHNETTPMADNSQGQLYIVPTPIGNLAVSPSVR